VAEVVAAVAAVAPRLRILQGASVKKQNVKD